MSAIIDIYCHIFPDRYFQEMTKAAPNLENIGKRLRGVTKLFDLDARFKEMDEFGDYRQIISLPNPAIEDIGAPMDVLWFRMSHKAATARIRSAISKPAS